MKQIVTAAALAGLMVLGGCDTPAAPTGTMAAAPICLPTYLIDHTHPVDDSTLLFTMRDGKVWKNTLLDPCVGLKIEQGFTYEVANDKICSNLQTIRVLRFGSICRLGDFTPVPPESVPKS
jgi:hypothetical protein